jgi:hypothetical protein
MTTYKSLHRRMFCAMKALFVSLQYIQFSLRERESTVRSLISALVTIARMVIEASQSKL